MPLLRPGAGPVRRLFCWDAGVRRRRGGVDDGTGKPRGRRAAPSNDLIKPSSTFDRTLVRLAQQRLFEATPQCIEYLLGVVGDKREKTADRTAAAKLILERTVATVERVDVRAVVAQLTPEADARSDEFSEQKRAAVLSLIESARARREA